MFVPKRASSCRRCTHGYTFDAWPTGLNRISSPSRRLARPHDIATAFRPAVVPETKTISSGPSAPTKRAVRSRAPASIRAARVDHGYIPRPGLAAWPASCAVTASTTRWGLAAVAALSR